MNNQYIHDYQIPPLSQSTAPSTSYNNSLWNQSISNPTNNTNPINTPGNQYRSQQQQQQQQQYSNTGFTSNSNRSHEIGGVADDKLKLQLKFKDNQIESLSNEIKILTESLNALNRQDGKQQQETVPASVNAIFVRLSKSRLQVLEELKDTKLRLESLITAYTLDPSNNSSENGRYDELEISHKILIKLENLKKENEDLLKALSFGKLKNLEMNVNLLKHENTDLKKENQELKDKLRALEKSQ